jgi:hypothetical protein
MDNSRNPETMPVWPLYLPETPAVDAVGINHIRGGLMIAIRLLIAIGSGFVDSTGINE